MSEFQVDVSFSLKDKVALITGGARGIGKAIAVLFARMMLIQFLSTLIQ